jgi:hypothetical protein
MEERARKLEIYKGTKKQWQKKKNQKWIIQYQGEIIQGK